jgi:DNA mismatch endonuclease (patch repair protein)
MAQIAGRDTKPEIVVRKLLYKKGYRYRLNVRRLRGTPDIVLAKHRKVIFVHGCFWHGHKNCPRAKRPTTNVRFWNKKISGNIERDIKNKAELRKQGWKVLVIWGCEVNKTERLLKKVDRFLQSTAT